DDEENTGPEPAPPGAVRRGGAGRSGSPGTNGQGRAGKLEPLSHDQHDWGRSHGPTKIRRGGTVPGARLRGHETTRSLNRRPAHALAYQGGRPPRSVLRSNPPAGEGARVAGGEKAGCWRRGWGERRRSATPACSRARPP